MPSRETGASPRVGVVASPYPCPGGVQTCIIELVAGLNQQGITPDIVWDDPMDWRVMGGDGVKASFSGGKLAISSSVLRRFPAWLRDLLSRFSVRFARLDLARYDFVYCFRPDVRMTAATPNLCLLTGPSHLDLPESIGVGCHAPGPLKKYIVRRLTPIRRPDPNARYVTIADWIAERFYREYGRRLPVIWPPARERTRPPGERSSLRKGFLYLSRFERYKNPRVMLSLAQRFPNVPVTIAGSTMGLSKEGAEIRSLAARMGLRNLTVVEDPSDDTVSHLFQSHSVFVFPAQWEHFGIVTVEAIRAGLLPLVHDSGGQREIVPIAALRFNDWSEMLEKAGEAIAMSPGNRAEIMQFLGKHTERGTATTYRAEMLRFLRGDSGVADETA